MMKMIQYRSAPGYGRIDVKNLGGKSQHNFVGRFNPVFADDTIHAYKEGLRQLVDRHA
jgi:hypothetical protein